MADSDILRGAIQAAAGNTLGLTQDQVLDLKRAQLREQQRENRGRRAERAGNQQEAQDFLAEDSRRFESTGSFEEQERYPDPFGIPVSPKDYEPDTSLADERAFDQQRGVRVFKDSGRGRQEYWRESGEETKGSNAGQWVRGKLYGDKKYIAGRVGRGEARPDLASPFTKNIATAPQGVGMGGPNGLATQLADMVARGEVAETDLVPGSSTKTIGDLMQEMAMDADPQLRAEADKAIGKQTAKREAARFTPAARAISDAAAEREVLANGYIANNDNGLSKIQNIQSLGLASKKMNKSGVNFENFSVTPGVDPSTFDDAVAYVQYLLEPGVQGPNGPTIGYADNQDRFIAETNMSGTDNIANSPVSRTATWMEGNLPDFGREQGTTFGPDRINPGNELRMLNERLGKFGLATGIRGIDDLEQVVQSYVVDAADSGRGIYKRDPEDPQKQLFVKDPGLDEVLGELGYTDGEKRRLAASLQSVEAAMLTRPVNGLQKELFAAGIPSESQASRQVRTIVPVAGSVYDGVTGTESDYDYYDSQYRSEPRVTTGFEKDVQLSRIKDERVGRDNKETGEKRKSVKSLLKLLDGSPERVFKDRDPSTIYATTPEGQQVLLPDAQQDLIDARLAQNDDVQKPFQAAVEGSKLDTKYNQDPERARFITNTKRNPNVAGMTNEERVKAFGPASGGVANEIIRRANEDEQIRTAPKPQDAIAAEFRARDSKFEAEGEARNAADERAVKTASKPSGVRATGQTLLGGQEVPRMKIYDDPQYAQTTSPLTSTIREAMSVTPSDGFSMASRNPIEAQKAAPMQEPLAGISYNETAPDPWTQPVGTGNGISNEIRKRKSTQSNVPLLSASPPSKEYRSGGTFKPDGPNAYRSNVRSEADYRQSVRNLGRVRGYGRNAAIAGGAVAGLAGLDALIGGERDNRDQEQY